MSKCSFSKSHRLKKSFEFRRVREEGVLFKDKTFGLSVAKNGAANHRLGLSISSSAVPLASRRVRIKRIIREVFRTKREKIKGGPYDIVVYVKRPLAGAFDADKARKEILALMERVRA